MWEPSGPLGHCVENTHGDLASQDVKVFEKASSEE